MFYKPSPIRIACLFLLALTCHSASAQDAVSDAKAWLALAPEARAASIPGRDLTRAESESITGLIFTTLAGEARAAREGELARVDASKDPQKAPKPPVMLGAIKIGDKEMKLLERTFGDAPEGGRSLWISLHGGGEAPERVNSQQWMNQIRLYQPEEGVYVAPRAPTDKWNLWHQAHMDEFLDRLIENHVIHSGVNPDRVYLLGYSAGGDGVYQLAPRMPDRFAAASMMAGHPNEAQPLGLRNLPFMIWCGEKDAGFKRNTVAAEWGRKLDDLAAADAGAYVHQTNIVAGKGHWMDRVDAAALPWMQKHTRNPWPKKLVWFQDDRTHTRFYWLEVPDDQAQKGRTLRATVVGQRVSLESADVSVVTLRLNDKLIDLDKPITVEFNGRVVFEEKLQRSVEAIWRSLQQRLDPSSVATARITVVDKPQ